MPTNPYPTLSPEGWITDPKKKIVWIFSDYCKAKHSQSIMHFGHITSLSFDEFNGNYEGIRSAEIIKLSLTKLYSSYFDTADIEVTDNSVVGSDTTLVHIKGILSQNGSRYQLNENLNVHNGKVLFQTIKR